MAIVGMIVVMGAVIGGYIMEHGKLGVLVQPAEFIIILGSALGTVMISTPLQVLTQVFQSILKGLKGEHPSKGAYSELLTLLYDLFQIARKEGALALETHIAEPEKSSVFSKYPSFLKNHHAVHFLSDTVSVILNGVKPMEIEALLDIDIETHHEENGRLSTVLSRVGDTMPGLGIVAAVLGVVIAMQAIDGPPEEIGHKVGAALIGTFLGIFMAYGFLLPLAANVEAIHLSEARYMQCIKEGLLAFAKGIHPTIAVEFARRSIFSDVRPSFEEIKNTLRGEKGENSERTESPK